MPWLDAAVGVHPHDADTGRRGLGGIAALRPRPARSSRSARPASTTTASSRRSSPSSRTCAATSRSRPRRQAGDPPLPVAAGEREAQDALLAELRAFGGVRPVIHSFSGPVDYAEAMLELGAVISISGLAFRDGEEATPDVVRLTPADRLLVETDSPFLSPPGAPRGRNTPEWVRVTAEWVANLRDEAPEGFGDQLVATYDRCFGRERVAA
jgi:Tat protein secretion system quality control protein TatD with DNase activity